MLLRWPEDFPDGCPPEEADLANGVFYDIVNANPPKSGDFIPLYHRNRGLAMRRVRNGIVTKCQTMGLSIFTDQSDALARARQYPEMGTGSRNWRLAQMRVKYSLRRGTAIRTIPGGKLRVMTRSR